MPSILIAYDTGDAEMGRQRQSDRPLASLASALLAGSGIVPDGYRIGGCCIPIDVLLRRKSYSAARQNREEWT